MVENARVIVAVAVVAVFSTGCSRDSEKATPSKGGDGAPKVAGSASATQCAKIVAKLVTAQNAFAADQNMRGQPEAYLRGVEPIIDLAAGRTPDYRTSGRNYSDPSRALVYMVKKSVLDVSDLICPSDPFVGKVDNLSDSTLDFSADGTSGRTQFSWSMQMSSQNFFSSPHPKMNSRVPLFGDRNPYCSVLVEIAKRESPTAGSEYGNTWNHDRAGQNLGFADGSVRFTDRANEVQSPLDPKQPQSPLGFDNIYGPGGPESSARPPVDGACLRPGTPGTGDTQNTFRIWLVD